ncbi:hypothetical protein FNB79_15455 [Formosa sediminum]|uniref:Uncharacterized protein n=1 Tax=Formosa sediminum TaxID=2594004 RepID=A0A516GUW2_9FLAO|nr:hypothetical protein [Formosa sediminum]QDO95307.1 hypothetical protein FNB79_15455 [Formosa sediminum]
MNNETTFLEKFGLTTTNINYSRSLNSVVTEGYTSKAGNTYFNSLRLVEGIIIKEDIGIGHTHSFLNGIKIYDLKNRTLIAEQTFRCEIYSKNALRVHLKKLLLDTLKKASQVEGYKLDMGRTLSIIEQAVNKALNQDQSKLFTKQLKGY